MLFRKREPRSSGARRRGEFRPVGDALEGRLLMAIDLGGASPPQLPLIATAPVGVNMAGTVAGGGAGFSVANVGDVNTDGFDDFVVGAPTVGNTGGIIVPAAGVPTVYLIFGSRTTTSTTIVDWLTNNSTQRVGDLAQLGNSQATQQNPITGVAGYPFAGIKIVTSQTTGSQLGASVAPITVNGVRSLLIGAPGHRDLNGSNPGTGRAYLIYGGNALNNVPNNQLDLDNPLSASNVSVVTFVSGAQGSSLGRAVAGPGDVITDGVNDLALGAPNATVNGLAGAGAVYVLSGLDVPTGTTTVNVLAIGQTSGVRGVVFAGATAGQQAGWSIAAAGNVEGSTAGTSLPTPDLLIGAPANTSGTPAAYLVYGATNLQSQQITSNNYSSISLARIGSTAAGGVTGLAIAGATGTDQTGWAVAGAGDFNGDGLADIMVGSPGYQASRGRVDLLYGQAASGTPLTGQITLDGTNPFPTLTLVGASAADLAGYSLSAVGRINATSGNPVLVGAPGFAANFGTAYLLPSQPSQLEGRYSLANAESQPVAATQFTLTTPGTPTFPAFFGASVSGRLTVSGQTRTADSDLVADFIIGAPGYTVTSPGRNVAGGVFILEGAFTPLQVPISTAITTTIGVDKPFGPFTNIDPTTPAAMNIYVFSNATITPAFAPVTQIDPTTVTVNGVAFPNATIAADPVDENKDGIPDAIVTITPRSNIGLTSSTTQLTVSGRTRSTGINANQRWTGSAQITVTGGGNNNGGGSSAGASATPVGLLTPTNFVPPFGPDRYMPPISALSRLGSYKPLPYRVAVNQYMPEPGFADRLVRYFYPKSQTHQFGSRNRYTGSGTSTLGRKVFTRGQWHAGDVKQFTHREHVIPSTLQTQRLGGQPRPWYQAHPGQR